MTTLDIKRLAEGLREQTAGFARAVEGADPAAQVPTCPEWRVRRLIGPIGPAHRWAAAIVRENAPLPVPDPGLADPGGPDAWEEWLLGGAEELVDATLEASGERWTVVGPVPAAFWLRRMMSDTAVHHYDAARTTGAAYEIAEDIAADVISEGLDLLSSPNLESFRPDLAALRGRGETIALRPRSAQEGWLVTRTPDGVRWRRGTGAADALVSGTLAELVLVFSRRVPPEDVEGDRALVEHWLDSTRF